jgi:hypothetical protein
MTKLTLTLKFCIGVLNTYHSQIIPEAINMEV